MTVAKLSKREFLKLMYGGSVVTVAGRYFTGCAVHETDSEVAFINQRGGFQCNPASQRVDYVRQAFAQCVRGGTEQQREAVFGKISLLPDEYLKYLEQCAGKGFFVSFEAMSGGIAGWCQYGQDPIQIALDTRAATNSQDVVVHEFGHAINEYVYRASGGAQVRGMLQKAYSDARGSDEGGRTWSYAMSQPVEYWACGVASFYCSDTCRTDLQRSYPIAWNFFNTVLRAPPGDTAVGGNPTPPATPPAVVPSDVPTQPSTPPSTPTLPPTTPPPSSPPQGGATAAPGAIDLAGLMQLFRDYLTQRSGLGLGLASATTPQIEMPHEGMEVNPHDTVFLELRPGARDFTESALARYTVYLAAPGVPQERALALPATFLFAPYLIDGHVVTHVELPDHAKIAALIGSRLERNSLGIAVGVVELRVFDETRRIVATRKLVYKQRHVDVNPAGPGALTGAGRS